MRRTKPPGASGRNSERIANGRHSRANSHRVEVWSQRRSRGEPALLPPPAGGACFVAPLRLRIHDPLANPPKGDVPTTPRRCDCGSGGDEPASGIRLDRGSNRHVALAPRSPAGSPGRTSHRDRSPASPSRPTRGPEHPRRSSVGAARVRAPRSGRRAREPFPWALGSGVSGCREVSGHGVPAIRRHRTRPR